MQSIAIVILGIIGMLLGWFVYSKFIASRIFKLDDSFVTPAHTMKDGVDYVPTNKVVLWGHHFTSVAGAAPIVGPAIAVYWGWVPAVLWVVFGTILFAGVHDMGALWAPYGPAHATKANQWALCLRPSSENALVHYL